MAAAEEDRHLRLTGEFDCDATPLATLRHSTSHVMAQAVKRLFPEVKVAIGPAIEDGFYYDFSKAEPFTPEDLTRIVGCDLADPGFWDGGIDIVEQQLEAAETAAFEAGRLS